MCILSFSKVSMIVCVVGFAVIVGIVESGRLLGLKLYSCLVTDVFKCNFLNKYTY